MSSDREAQKAAFLAAAGLSSARRQPLAGDASTRAYERLHLAAGESLILMDQPPSAESSPCPPDATPAERAKLGYNALARALIRTLTRAEEDVPSPTFTLVQTYDAAFPLTHFDLYRLGSATEADELGLDEALAEGAAVIEWPQRLEGRLPHCRLDIEIEIEGEGRRARLTPHGDFEGRPLEF